MHICITIKLKIFFFSFTSEVTQKALLQGIDIKLGRIVELLENARYEYIPPENGDGENGGENGEEKKKPEENEE